MKRKVKFKTFILKRRRLLNFGSSAYYIGEQLHFLFVSPTICVICSSLTQSLSHLINFVCPWQKVPRSFRIHWIHSANVCAANFKSMKTKGWKTLNVNWMCWSCKNYFVSISRNNTTKTCLATFSFSLNNLL